MRIHVRIVSTESSLKNKQTLDERKTFEEGLKKKRFTPRDFNPSSCERERGNSDRDTRTRLRVVLRYRYKNTAYVPQPWYLPEYRSNACDSTNIIIKYYTIFYAEKKIREHYFVSFFRFVRCLLYVYIYII